MKKVSRILLILSILSLGGCDFVRKVAGRPTSAEIETMAQRQEQRRKEVQDSVEAADRKAMQSGLARMDSLRTASFFDKCGVRSSNSISFGEPVDTVLNRFNVVVGVYSNMNIAINHFNKLQRAGFSPYFIHLPRDLKVLCLGGTDDKEDTMEMMKDGIAKKVCPSDAWVYVRK